MTIKTISDGYSSIHIKNGKVELIVGNVDDYNSYYEHTTYQCDNKIIEKLMKTPNNTNTKTIHKLILMLNSKCEVLKSYHYDPEDEDEAEYDDPWEEWEDYCDLEDDSWCEE